MLLLLLLLPIPSCSSGTESASFFSGVPHGDNNSYLFKEPMGRPVCGHIKSSKV